MWYAIRTAPGQEDIVKQEIRSVMSKNLSNTFRVLYCIRKKRYMGQWHNKRERFLPEYMFLTTEQPKGELKTVKSDLNTVEIANSIAYHDLLMPLKQEEEEFLVKLIGGEDQIGMSYGTIRNGVLKIWDGVLVGMESRVKKIDRHKRKGYITMKINGEEQMAEIGLEITEKT